MASRPMDTKLRRLPQLKNNVKIEFSMLAHRTQEFQSNLQSFLNEMETEASQLFSSAKDHRDVQQLEKLLKKIGNRTEMVTKLNTHLFEMLEENCDDETWSQSSSDGYSNTSDSLTHQDQQTSGTPRSMGQAHPDMVGRRDVHTRPDASIVSQLQDMSSAVVSIQNSLSALPSSSTLKTPLPLLPHVPSASSFPNPHQLSHSQRSSLEMLHSSKKVAASEQYQTDFSTSGFNYQQTVDQAGPGVVHRRMAATAYRNTDSKQSASSAVGQENRSASDSQGKELEQDKLTMKEDLKPVVIVYAENPWSFYIAKCEDTLGLLNSQISEHIEALSAGKPAPFVGMLCLAQFTDNNFYRARVVRLYPDDYVGVFFVDYGNYHITTSASLLILPESLHHLPAMAIHCCLCRVTSSSKTGLWTQRALDLFKDFVFRDQMLCRPVLLPQEGSSLPAFVDLVTSTSVNETRESVNDFLLKMNVAKSIDIKDLLVRLNSTGHRPQGLGAVKTHSPANISGVSAVTVQHAQLERNFALKDTVSEEMANILPKKHLQGILQQVQKYSSNLNKTADKSSAKRQGYNVDNQEQLVKNEQMMRYSKEADGTVGNVRAVEGYKSVFKALNSGDNCCEFDAMASEVISPSDFYVHLVCEESGNLMLSLQTRLNAAFSELPMHVLKLQNTRLIARPDTLCCVKMEDGNYYRGLTKDMRSAANSMFKQVKVFLMDHGSTVWASRSLVYPLPDTFLDIAPQAIWCSLAYIRPASANRPRDPDGGDVVVEWDRLVLEQFQHLLGGDRVVKVLSTQPLPKKSRWAADFQTEPLQVIVVDVTQNNLCINHDLILQGLAAQDIPQIDVLDDNGHNAEESAAMLKDDTNDESMWNDMKKDATSLRNTYNVDANDAGVIMTGVKSRGGPNGICRFIKTPSGCHKGDKCPYLHVEPGRQRGVSGNLKAVAVFDEDQSGLLPVTGAMVTVEVSCVINPSMFYVTLPWGPLGIAEVARNTDDVKEYTIRENLENLTAAMEKHYKKSRLDGDYSVYAPGEAVAAWSEKSECWLRAKVIQAEPNDEVVLVMFVDFGNMELVREQDIRQLDQRFLFLTPQAVECCLVGVGPSSPDGSWPDTSRFEFFKIVCGKTLVAHVRERMGNGRLGVDLYDTSKDHEDISMKTLLISRGLAEDTSLLPAQRRGDRSSPEIAADGDVTFVPG